MITNCYINLMTKGKLSDWFEKAYLQYQIDHGRISLDVFAAHLQISRGYLSQLLNGTKNSMGRHTAVAIAEKLNDYSLLDILGYSRPEPKPVPFSSLPPEFIKLLEEIDLEIAKTFRERGITEYSAEAESIAREIMEKYGARLTDTKNSGKPLN